MHKRILPYKMGSRSAKNLREALDILQVHPDPARSRYKAEYSFYSRRAGRTLHRRPTKVINWGSSVVPEHLASNVHWLNHPAKVALACDKLSCLQVLSEQDIPCPEWTTSQQTVQEWLDQGHVVFARTLTRAHSARGLVELEGDATIISAPLYTKYIKKQFEYRVHCLPNGSLHVVQKRRRRDTPDDQVNWRVRNHGNGFIFAAELEFKPSDIETLAQRTKQALGLDFCALDIVYNSHTETSYVIEANSACALEGRTLDIYAEAFREVL